MRLIDATPFDFNKVVIPDVGPNVMRGYWLGAKHVYDEIDDAPTVDAAPVVHGEWIGEHGEHVPLTDGSPDSSCSCSICGKWLVGSDEYATFGYYCPNCGAKMDLEEHNGTDNP